MSGKELRLDYFINSPIHAYKIISLKLCIECKCNKILSLTIKNDNYSCDHNFATGKKQFLLSVENALNESTISELFKQEVRANLDELALISKRITAIETTLRHYVVHDHNTKILHSIPGIGVLIASALASKYSDPRQFDNARDLSVHIGLTPRLVASGNKQKMLGISKRGDRYLRKQLIHGARALMIFAPKRKDDALCVWALQIKQRRGYNVAVVALANRMAQLTWTLLNKQELYRSRLAH